MLVDILIFVPQGSLVQGVVMVLERKVRHFPEVPILQFLDGRVPPRVFLLKWGSLQADFFNSYNYSFIHFLDVISYSHHYCRFRPC